MSKSLNRVLLLGISVVALAVPAGCGDDDESDGNETAASTAAGFDSPYCVTARKWAVHELNGGGDAVYARGGPPALEKWWREQTAYLKTSLRQAPPEIRDAEVTFERAIRTRLTPLVEKYGFDAARLQAEGTAEEKALGAGTPPDAEKADQARRVYQDRVCGYGGSPPAADVTFKASAAAKPYCKAVAAQQKDLGKIESSGLDPEALQSYATSERFPEALDAQDATAPSEIAADVKADNEWERTRKLEVLEEYDYDVRRILREGSAEDLAVFTDWDPAIVKHDSRVTAYQEQVCGG